MIRDFIKSRPLLKRAVLLVLRLLAPFGAGFRLSAIVRFPVFFAELQRFRAMGGKASAMDLYPCLFDRTTISHIDAQYFHQAIWAFRAIQKHAPTEHVDIASEVNFVGLLTCITVVTFVDIRPLELDLPNYRGLRGSLLDLPFPDESLHSLSCLHVIEHVGLGRYGDPIDPLGPEKSCAEIVRVVAPGGYVYVSVPVGRPRVSFNGLRVFAVPELIRMFPGLKLESMALVDAHGGYHPLVAPESVDIQEAGAGNDFGLGLFVFRKEFRLRCVGVRAPEARDG
jgi:SAM-dependent methyltransferase